MWCQPSLLFPRNALDTDICCTSSMGLPSAQVETAKRLNGPSCKQSILNFSREDLLCVEFLESSLDILTNSIFSPLFGTSSKSVSSRVMGFFWALSPCLSGCLRGWKNYQVSADATTLCEGSAAPCNITRG